MRIFHRFPTHHDDLIHDISYDYYGKRLATCSSDQKIKVWDQNENGEWVLTTEWKAHSGSVWKLAWAHPEFGQIIASCSFDRTVVIWEEAEDEKGNKKWISRATLVDSRDSVSDIKFAPRHVGLKLATCSADGFVRIYEAIDVMNLTHWPLIDEFEAHRGVTNCISWNPSPYYKPMLVVGSNDYAAKLWEYNDSTRKWVIVESLLCGGADNVIHDVSWAPNLGRSYHLIALACKDRTVRIWKVATADKNRSEVREVLTRDDHHAEVWRVDWNITGTILASSGDDGNVRMWKANLTGDWKPLSVIRGEEETDN